ncbi:MAG: hypothetical protein IKD71_09945 [Solobacterium sp.]|nr:hypothetical protein [Solobacterium sp.]
MNLKQLLLCANLAVLGIVAKPLFSPLFNFITDFVRIPGGSMTAGVSMLFLVCGAALVYKPCTALLIGFLQGVLALSTGISAVAGALVLITYSLPGISIDAIMMLGQRIPLKERMILAGSLGVLTGSAATNLLYFHLALIPFLLFYIFGILSGGIGGYLAWRIMQRIPEHYRKEFG